MKHAARAVALAGAILVVLVAPARADVGLVPYQHKSAQLDTPWDGQVSLSAPRCEYPRPQLARARWLCLNGQWQFGPATPGAPPPFMVQLPETILVPFPIQSALSGIMRNQPDSWYRRTFTVPPGWAGQRVLLNFGAVSYATAVWVNGQQVGTHQGDYDSFSFDITAALHPGVNELVVGVHDPMDSGGQPIGKQRAVSGLGVFTAASGIWQTVWLEPVPAAYVTSVDSTADLAGSRLLVTVQAANAPPDARADVTVTVGAQTVAMASGPPGRAIALAIPQPRLWSPADPFLYGLRVQLSGGDAVTSYAAMRSVGVAQVGGVARIVLNGRFIFENGVLDQGYWPDGVYTAPTDEALRSDLATAWGLGFNTIRMHEKVEPARWYFDADRLGMLVWQDMPAMNPGRGAPAPADQAEFERELRAMIEQHRSDPSIIGWVPFNENWGAFDVARIAGEVKALDPTRLVDANSGGANCCNGSDAGAGDVLDTHLYTGPFAVPPDPHRASITGEFGGLPVDESIGAFGGWCGDDPLSSTVLADEQTATARYRNLASLVAQEEAAPGLSGSIYTELTDVQTECGGLVTYDRRSLKLDPAVVRASNAQIAAAALTPGAPGVAPGAVAAWSFDEGAGPIAQDTSGAGHDLTFTPGAGFAPGRVGSAYGDDGAAGDARTAAPVVDTLGSFTVSAWVQAAHDTHGQTAAALSQDGTQVSGFELGYVDARWAFWMPLLDQPTSGVTPDYGDCPHGGQCIVRASNTYDDGRFPIQPGRWYHLVGVRDAATDSIVLYVDGMPVDSRTYAGGWPASGPFVVGAGFDDGVETDRFAGAIDDVRVWNRAITPAEVNALARA